MNREHGGKLFVDPFGKQRDIGKLGLRRIQIKTLGIILIQIPAAEKISAFFHGSCDRIRNRIARFQIDIIGAFRGCFAHIKMRNIIIPRNRNGRRISDCGFFASAAVSLRKCRTEIFGVFRKVFKGIGKISVFIRLQRYNFGVRIRQIILFCGKDQAAGGHASAVQIPDLRFERKLGGSLGHRGQIQRGRQCRGAGHLDLHFISAFGNNLNFQAVFRSLLLRETRIGGSADRELILTAVKGIIPLIGSLVVEKSIRNGKTVYPQESNPRVVAASFVIDAAFCDRIFINVPNDDSPRTAVDGIKHAVFDIAVPVFDQIIFTGVRCIYLDDIVGARTALSRIQRICTVKRRLRRYKTELDRMIRIKIRRACAASFSGIAVMARHQ